VVSSEACRETARHRASPGGNSRNADHSIVYGASKHERGDNMMMPFFLVLISMLVGIGIVWCIVDAAMNKIIRFYKLETMSNRIREIFYWIVGATVHAAVAFVILGLSLGILYMLADFSCRIFGCVSGFYSFLNSPVSILISIAVVVGLYRQVKEPIDISKHESRN